MLREISLDGEDAPDEYLDAQRHWNSKGNVVEKFLVNLIQQNPLFFLSEKIHTYCLSRK